MNLTDNKLGNLAQSEFLSHIAQQQPSLLEFCSGDRPGTVAKICGRFLAISIPVGMLSYLLSTPPAKAQIVPDSTLPTNSSVRERGDTSLIEAGTTKGTNLFHSFDSFSIPTGTTAYFNNSAAIENIISRVTGKFVSSIDGAIAANGAANLFLLNPNGIIFGGNARLNIGGSFLASTANSLKFADGTQFSATATQVTPLLTVSVPVGLQFGGNSGAIRVLGKGHDVIAADYQPILRGNSSDVGLQVQPQQTLAIVGGDVSLEGGVVTAQAGRIELGSVDNGLVKIERTNSGWSLGYEGVSTFKDIQLDGRSLVDASGGGGSSIQIQGRKLQLGDSSLVLIQNQGVLPTGT
jgi:filamentous hemagglutinin family protein